MSPANFGVNSGFEVINVIMINYPAQLTCSRNINCPVQSNRMLQFTTENQDMCLILFCIESKDKNVSAATLLRKYKI